MVLLFLLQPCQRFNFLLFVLWLFFICAATQISFWFFFSLNGKKIRCQFFFGMKWKKSFSKISSEINYFFILALKCFFLIWKAEERERFDGEENYEQSSNVIFLSLNNKKNKFSHFKFFFLRQFFCFHFCCRRRRGFSFSIRTEVPRSDPAPGTGPARS